MFLCSICGRKSEKMARVTYHFLDRANDWIGIYCVFKNETSNRWQIKHKGIIGETRKMADGNITWVEIDSLGY